LSVIKILPPQEARKIAAGEVIDRPAALIREFLDNAIDAGAANIDVNIEGGGGKKCEVADDGEGMSREDMELCFLPHATSKIQSLDDLNVSTTLGFRGEALAAAAAVARLEIISSRDGREAWRLTTELNRSADVEQGRRTRGTTVRALNLFDSIPARKKFLKRDGSEAALCRAAFIDKALVFPQINFRYSQDSSLKCFFPAVSSKKDRFAAAVLQAGEEVFLHEINVTGNGFSVAIVIGGPELYRSDRRMLFIFANGRRINDYALVQALVYGSQGFFPNGTYPVGAVYVDIDPSLADFNIHPAKREARFRDPGAIHHAISGGLRNYFHHYFVKQLRSGETPYENTELFEKGFTQGHGDREESVKEISYSPLYSRNPDPYFITSVPPPPDAASFASESAPDYTQARFAGRAFGLFILIECGQRLYIIDQHAAHERILYNRFLSGAIPKQELLAPIPFGTESEDEDRFLEAKRGELDRLGVEIKNDGKAWFIEALPADWRLGDSETVKEILELRNAGENMAERWAAALCCHQALRDGDYLDDSSALELGRQALSLPDPHCPHGRPVWTEISRDALFKAVKRV